MPLGAAVEARGECLRIHAHGSIRGMQRKPGDAAPYGRVFAALHLTALALLVLGVLASFVIPEDWAWWAVFPPGIVLCIQANLLGRRDTALDGRPPWRGRLSNYQYAWYHLLLGQEITRAWRLLREN